MNTENETLDGVLLGDELIEEKKRVRFQCPKCGQHLAAEISLADQTVNCSNCKRHVRVPTPS